MRCAAFATFAFGVIAVLAGASHAADDKIEYNRDIRPILVNNCFACHGADSAARQADLRLDRRESAIEAKAIVPGATEKSSLVERIDSDDPEMQMPPPASKKTLSAREKELLKRWISHGAEYELHWSLIAPVKPGLPAVKQESWARNPIDHFVLAKLESLGLSPAAEADRATLARRLSLDLTGLPPAPEAVAEFIHDPSDNAYERYVDSLLASPRWGEHRGRHWLDVARYADTHGIHNDNFREMWTYRDWVINAFNANMPFDKFTVEQLAGDLLPDPSIDQQIATGFNRCNITTSEGGAIDEEYLVLYTRDRTETVAQTWMGTTAGCAVCHDHKFDPLSQKEFYSLAAFFNNTTQKAMDMNARDTPPIIHLPQASDEKRWEAVVAGTEGANANLESRRTALREQFETWLASDASASKAGELLPAEPHLAIPLREGKGKSTRIHHAGATETIPLSDTTSWQESNSGATNIESAGAALELADACDFERDQPFTCSAWVRMNPNNVAGAVAARMEAPDGYRGWDLWTESRRAGMHLIHQWPDNAVKVLAAKPVPPNVFTHVTITYDGSSKASGIAIYYDGVRQATTTEKDSLSDSIRSEASFIVGQRSAGDTVKGLAVQDIYIFKQALTSDEVKRLAKSARFASILNKPSEERSKFDQKELLDWWLGDTDEAYQKAKKELAALTKEKAQIEARGTIAHVMHEKEAPPEAYILVRGEYERRGERVSPDTPKVLPQFPKEAPRNRLGLAQWLLREDHPLTARVTVNRFWQEVFGGGIVRTAGDFGMSGEMPSNQPLLDWLAVDFREANWDVIRFYKQIVMSATYRQSAQVTPEKLQKDPDNRYFSRGPRYRMDAEMVRDYALAASGLLKDSIGGPSVKPYQPEGVWEAVAMPSSNTKEYKPDTGDKLYRRSLYTFWKRSAPPANMEIFNAPSREMCTVRRERTNTPLQALVTLNDPQLVEAARRLAESAMDASEADTGRIDFIGKRVLCRSVRPAEAVIIADSLISLREHYNAKKDHAADLVAVGDSEPDKSLDKVELAAWTMIANQLLNLDEVLNK